MNELVFFNLICQHDLTIPIRFCHFSFVISNKMGIQDLKLLKPWGNFMTSIIYYHPDWAWAPIIRNLYMKLCLSPLSLAVCFGNLLQIPHYNSIFYHETPLYNSIFCHKTPHYNSIFCHKTPLYNSIFCHEISIYNSIF